MNTKPPIIPIPIRNTNPQDCFRASFGVRVGNKHSFDPATQFVVSGWQAMHSDEGIYCDRHRIDLCIVPAYVDPDAVLVHKVGGRLVMSELTVGEPIRFSGFNEYGIFPRDVAIRAVNLRSKDPLTNFVNKTFRIKRKSKYPFWCDTKPRLIWKFVRIYPDIQYPPLYSVGMTR